MYIRSTGKQSTDKNINQSKVEYGVFLAKLQKLVQMTFPFYPRAYYVYFTEQMSCYIPQRKPFKLVPMTIKSMNQQLSGIDLHILNGLFRIPPNHQWIPFPVHN